MKRHHRQHLATALSAALTALALGGLAAAQAGLDLSWYTVDGGGARSSGGGYTLEGSIGQPDAGTLSGGGYMLAGGVWIADVTQTPSVTPTGTLPTITPTATGAAPTPTPTPTATPSPTLTPTPEAPAQTAGDDDTRTGAERVREEGVRLTDEQRQQRERTNQSSLDDYRTEGNVVAVACEAAVPAVTIVNRDGRAEVRLLGEAAAVCGTIQVGDYLEASGEKQTEALFEADDVTVTRNGRRVR